MNYYPRYMGDFQSATMHLSMTEDGAYNRLLDHYYSKGKPLPADLRQLYRIARATEKFEQLAVDVVAEEFFPVGPDGLRHNDRADEEIAKWQVMAERNREVGKSGGRPRKKPTGNPDGFPEETKMVSSTEPRNNPGGSRGETQMGGPEETQSITQKKPSPDPTPDPEKKNQNQIQNQREDARAREDANRTDTNLPDDATKRERMAALKSIYPMGIYREHEWLNVERLIDQHLEDGHAWDVIYAGTERYAAQQGAKGSIGTQFVLSPAKFFARTPGKPPMFLDAFPLPATKADQRLGANAEAAAEAKRRIFGRGS